MKRPPKILAFAGSTRTESFNKKLVKIAAEGARAAGAEVTFLDLRDIPLPLFDQDLEAREGMPANGRKLKDLLMAHDGFLISAPEYNSSISGVLKNAIDWASRREANEQPLVCFRGKVTALMSASPSLLGGLRGLVHVRSLLSNIGVLLLPDQLTVSKADEAFQPDGSLVDEKKAAAARDLGKKLSDLISKLL